jgi:hypothetical protein
MFVTSLLWTALMRFDTLMEIKENDTTVSFSDGNKQIICGKNSIKYLIKHDRRNDNTVCLALTTTADEFINKLCRNIADKTPVEVPIGISYCHNEDQFCKKTGVSVAKQKMRLESLDVQQAWRMKWHNNKDRLFISTILKTKGEFCETEHHLDFVYFGGLFCIDSFLMI